jgi:hypothetical protein
VTEKAPEVEAVLVRSATSRRRAGRQTGSSGSQSDRGPTRDELYAEARRLDIEGRSKMNKKELERAVGRVRGRSGARSQEKANPVEVQAFLEGVGYPTETRRLVSEARNQGASDEVRTTLGRLPDREFDSPTEVSEAIGKL